MQFRRERVRVETPRHIIEGTLQLPNEGYRSRTTDFLNAQTPTELESLGVVDEPGPTVGADAAVAISTPPQA